MLSNLYVLIGGLVSVLGLVLAAFFSFKKAGADSEKVKTLSQEVSADDKTLNEVSKENDFRGRVTTDPAYLERMRARLNKEK